MTNRVQMGKIAAGTAIALFKDALAAFDGEVKGLSEIEYEYGYSRRLDLAHYERKCSVRALSNAVSTSMS